jgi:cytochrome c oxidase cbb3-type subunit 3
MNVLEHTSDGIEEYDNPLPRWWLYLFYFTIVFAIGYCIYYPSFWFWPGVSGWTTDRQYRASLPPVTNTTTFDYSTVNLDQNAKDPNTVALGQAIFAKNCAVCHGEHLEGKIGPCLTDSEWIYGGKDIDILTSISKGRKSGMMPVWSKKMKPKEIITVATFVRSQYTGAPPKNPIPGTTAPPAAATPAPVATATPAAAAAPAPAASATPATAPLIQTAPAATATP